MSTEETYNAADPKQVKERTRKADRQQEHRDDDLRELLKLAAFRRFIWHLICERCQIYTSPFHPNGSTQTLNIGRRDVGLELFATIERIDAALIPQLMNEYRESLKA